VVHATSAGAAAIGALLSPFPLLDELVLAPAHAAMSWGIGRLHDLPLASMPWRPIGRTILNGLVARAAANLVVAFIPGVAAAANALTAAALTEWLGRYVDEACTNPSGAQAAAIADILSSLREAASFMLRQNEESAAAPPP
jgi:uncharacterized protein (DUF697 family)